MKKINGFAAKEAGAKLEKFQYELPELVNEEVDVNKALKHLEDGKARFRIVLKA